MRKYTSKDIKKKYEKIGNKRVSELTDDDNLVIALYHMYNAQSEFQHGLMTAEDLDDKELLQEFMYVAKSMVFDVEALGVVIGSMN